MILTAPTWLSPRHGPEAEVTQKQLADLKRIGEKESLKSASGELSAAMESTWAPVRNSATRKFAAPWTVW